MSERNALPLSVARRLRKVTLQWHNSGIHLFSTKQVVAAYVKKFIAAPGDPPLSTENLLIVPGCNAAYDMLAYCLFSAGDVVLCPAPFYGRLFDNFEERAHVQIRPVPFVCTR